MFINKKENLKYTKTCDLVTGVDNVHMFYAYLEFFFQIKSQSWL